MTKKLETEVTSILDLLDPERRQALVDEIATKAVRDLVDSSETIGQLVDALTAHRVWGDLREVPVDVLTDGGAAVTPKADAAKRGRPKKTAAKKVAPKAKPKTAARKPRVATDAAVVTAVLDWIGRNPGKGSREIVDGSGVGKEAVGKALAKLRKDGAVVTEGQKSAMTYGAAPVKAAAEGAEQ